MGGWNDLMCDSLKGSLGWAGKVVPSRRNIMNKGDPDRRDVKARGRLGRGDWGMDKAEELGLNWGAVGSHGG